MCNGKTGRSEGKMDFDLQGRHLKCSVQVSVDKRRISMKDKR